MSTASDARFIMTGPHIVDHIAEASVDFNGLGWDEPGVVTGWITRYIDPEPLTPGRKFVLTDPDESAPSCRAEYLGLTKTWTGHPNPFLADFRVIEWLG